MSPRTRTGIGLAAVALTAVGIGTSVWRGTALQPGEMVLGAILLSAWVLAPTLLHFDGLRTPGDEVGGQARTIAIVAACAAALAWSELFQRTDLLSPSWGYATAPLVVLAAGWLARRALRVERLRQTPRALDRERA